MNDTFALFFVTWAFISVTLFFVYVTLMKRCNAGMLYSRPLKSAHLRNIVRKQYPADFFNKPQKSPHGSFEVVCGGS